MNRNVTSFGKAMLIPYLTIFFFLVFPNTGFGQKQLQIHGDAKNQKTIVQDESSKSMKGQPQVIHESPLEQFKNKKEDIKKRDAFSKHFINDDGSRTAVISAGPIHYEKNGKFEDIKHNIVTTGNTTFPYANTANLFESYFGVTAHRGVKNSTSEGEMVEFLNTKMYWEVAGQAVQVRNSSNTAITIDTDKVYYKNIYGAIDAEFIIESGLRKLNYIIPTRTALGIIPNNADYLVFTEDVVLPNGWTYSTNNRQGILIVDNNGKTIYNYKNPISTDIASDLYNENTVYNIFNNNNVLTIETKVKTSWLLNTSRQFPVKVDPTVSYYPNASTHRTGQLLQSGGGAYGNYAVGYSGGFYRSYVSFDVTGIPDSAIINTTALYHTVGATTGMTAGSFGSEIRSFLTDPESASYPNWIDVYNAVVNASNSPSLYVTVSNLNTIGLKNVTLGTAANTDLKNALVTDKFTLSYRPAGSYTTSPARYAQFYGESDATRNPYLSVTYTEAAVCSGSPTGGTTLLTPNSGTQGQSFTGSVSGSTSGASGLTYQWESGPTASGPWTNVTGATNITHAFTAPYTNGSTYYRRKITCSGNDSWSTPVVFTTNCTPSHTNGNCSGVDCRYVGISNVNLGSINNTTSYSSAPAYNYYSTQTTDVSEGIPYSISVRYSDAGSPVNPGKIAAWIDWNGDGEFNGANEYLGTLNATANNQVVTFNFNVPSGTSIGTKRLRIRSALGGSGNEDFLATDACTVKVYGETEDYNVNVVVINMVCSTLSNLTATLGSPANGVNHFINLNWTALTGATSYDVEFSMDGSSYSAAGTGNVPNNYTQIDAGDNPNIPLWFRVRAKNSTSTCDWTFVGPIYTAADIPELPLLTNAIGTSLDLTIQNEIPVTNPANTEYSIYCLTTDQYVQADGSLGSSEVFLTKATWGTKTIINLTANTEYCFNLKAKNGDGHIVDGATELTNLETFTTTANFEKVTSGTGSKWWVPAANTLAHSTSGGCDGGYVGYSSSFTNFASSMLRSPAVNCNGLNTVTMTFDISNSYFATQPNDKITFSMYAPTVAAPSGTYINAVSVNNQNTNTLLFNEVRNCQSIDVVFDLSNVTNKSSIYFYFNTSSGYNNSNIYSLKIDNIVLMRAAPSACITLQTAPTAMFHNTGDTAQLTFNNSRINSDEPIFRLSHEGSTTVTNYQIEVSSSSTFTGTPISQTFTGAFTANTETNFTFSNASGMLNSGTTYYVRARLNAGFGYGEWTTEMYSFTYDSSIITPSWFQTTQAQLATANHSGTEASNNNDIVPLSSSGVNAITNGNFNNTTTGWTITRSYNTTTQTVTVVNANDGSCSTCSPAAKNLRIGTPWSQSGLLNGDKIIVSQQIDLTNISEITFNVGAFRSYGGIDGLTPGNTRLEFLIGGTLSNDVGTSLYSRDLTTNSSNYYPNITINTAGLTGVQVIKFVMRYTNTWTANTTAYFYINNIQALSPPTGTATSTKIELASVQNSTRYESIKWNQTLNGGTAVLKVQQYNGSSWTDVAGYTNITVAGDGEKTYSLAEMTPFDTIRLAATLNGSATIALHDWSVIFENPCDAAITSVTNGSGCAGIALQAAGSASTTEYLWYDAQTGGNLVATTVTGQWTTPVLSNTTTYYVAASNGTCESARTAVTATVTPTAAEMMFWTPSATSCQPVYVMLYAETMDDNSYQVNWYTTATGGTPFHTGYDLNYYINNTITLYVSATDGTCESVREPIQITLEGRIWNGSISTDWSNANNWTPASIPTLNECVTIPATANNPIVTANAEAKSLSVLADAELLVITNASITVRDEVNVAATANFTLENDGYLKQITGGQTNNNIGKITVHKNSAPMFRLDATAWSSPVENQRLYAFSPETVSGRIYEYNENTNAWDNTTINNNSVFIPAKGYSIRSANNYPTYTPTATPEVFEGAFTGRPFNGTIGINVTNNNKGNNYIGNPYPSPIDAYAFLSNNASVEGLYFWTHEAPPINGVYAANNYASYTTFGATASAAGGEIPDGIINVGQGFVIKTNQSVLLQFTNDLREISSNGQFFRRAQTEKHRFWLNLSDSQANYNQILLGYMEGASNAFDHKIDGKFFGHTGSAIYSLIDTEKYVIQGRSLPFDSQDIIPLGFRAMQQGIFKIGLDRLDGLFLNGQTIYLKDKLNNITHNLSEGDYSFISEVGTFETRFEITYIAETLGVNNPEMNNNNWIVFKADNKINIQSKGFDIESIEVYDITGRLLIQKDNINSNAYSCPAYFADQVLIVKINKILSKKVL